MDRLGECEYSHVCDEYCAINPLCFRRRAGKERYATCQSYRNSKNVEMLMDYLYYTDAGRWR